MLKIIEILVLGGIAFFAIGWQIVIINNDSSSSEMPKRLIPPFAVGTLILLGTAALALLGLFDGNKSAVARSDAWGDVWKAFVFFIVMTAKSWLAPIMLGIAGASVAYYGFEYGEMRWFPFISAVLDWMFGRLPEWLEIAYLIVSLFYLGWAAIDGALDA